ncbi:hypothetical protein PVK06_011383 [Gossypium arboreum]|uniref:Uncharacterized protein n=1 Tax=Gossypium arboreum TaxID=29729 RepID=A0ABR0Q9X6_GOSAR|nr:hypothetical protein PVK06_011383 [Gossypium arboreum]
MTIYIQRKLQVIFYLNAHVPNISLFNVDELFLKERYLIHADLGDQSHIFDPGNSFGAQERLGKYFIHFIIIYSNPFSFNTAKDLGMNLLEEGGNVASLKAQFQTHRYNRLTLPQGPTTMSNFKQIKPRVNQRQDSRIYLFKERGNDTCKDEMKFIKFHSSKLPNFKFWKSVDL